MSKTKWLSILLGLSCVFCTTITWASNSSSINVTKPHAAPKLQRKTPPPPSVNAGSYILIAAGSGKILAENNAHERIPPASLTKMMTMYVVSQALKSGQLTLDDEVHISRKANQAEGSRMFIKAGSKVPVKDLVLGIIIDSGNDASIAMAEHMAGSEETFVSMMNAEAARLGMKETHFTDCTGMPDDDHYSTAYDMAILSNALITHFPEFYPWYSQKWFTYNNIKQPNRNRLLWRDDAVDGIKTGHTSEAGYCLAASANKDNMRLISIVMNSPSESIRAEATQQLLTYGFRFFKTHHLFAPNDTVSQPRIWKGDAKTLPLGVTKELTITVPSGQYDQLKVTTQLPKPLTAPIEKGAKIGTLTVTLDGKQLLTSDLIAKETVAKGGFFSRISDSISMAIHGAADDEDEDA